MNRANTAHLLRDTEEDADERLSPFPIQSNNEKWIKAMTSSTHWSWETCECVRRIHEYVSVIDLTNVGCRSVQLLLLLNAASKLTSSIDLSIFYSTHTDPAHQQQQRKKKKSNLNQFSFVFLIRIERWTSPQYHNNFRFSLRRHQFDLCYIMGLSCNTYDENDSKRQKRPPTNQIWCANWINYPEKCEQERMRCKRNM